MADLATALRNSAPQKGDVTIDENGLPTYSNVSSDPNHVGYFSTKEDSEGNVVGQQWNPSKYDFTGATFDPRANQYTMPDGSKLNYDLTSGEISNYRPNYASLTVDPSNIRQGYRNQNYAANLGDNLSYDFQGTKLDPSQVNQGEYLVDPSTNKYQLDKNGNPIPVYRQPSGGGFTDWMTENGWMLPVAMGTAGAAMEFAPAMFASDVGMVDAAGNIIGAGSEGAAVGATGAGGASQWSPEIIAQANASKDAIGYIASLSNLTPAEIAAYTTTAGTAGMSALQKAMLISQGMSALNQMTGGTGGGGYSTIGGGSSGGGGNGMIAYHRQNPFLSTAQQNTAPDSSTEILTKLLRGQNG